MTKITNNAALYMRTATNDEAAITTQRLELNEYIAELVSNGPKLNIKEYIDIGYNGYSSERPGLQALKLAAQNGELDLIVTTKTHTLHRNITTAQELIQEFEASDVMVEFTSTNNLLDEEDGHEINNK